jgi:hypothetical protein
VTWDRKAVEADAHLSVKALCEKYGIGRSTAMRIRREQGTSLVQKPVEAAGVPGGALQAAIEELEKQRARLSSQLQAIGQALEALRRVEI